MGANGVPDGAGDAIQYPSISIVKDFGGEQQENVFARGAGSSFTLAVTNTGNLILSCELIENTVDTRLHVTNVSGTKGASAANDVTAQMVAWLILNLSPADSVTITLN